MPQKSLKISNSFIVSSFAKIKGSVVGKLWRQTTTTQVRVKSATTTIEPLFSANCISKEKTKNRAKSP